MSPQIKEAMEDFKKKPRIRTPRMKSLENLTPTRELTISQKRFCEEFFKDFNAPQAMLRAGFSEESLASNSARMIDRPEVKAELKRISDLMSEKTLLKVQRVLEELMIIGFSNIQDFLEEGNVIKDLTELPRTTTAIVESVQRTETTNIMTGQKKVETKLKLYSKLDALDKIMKHLGMYELDNTQKKPIINVNVFESDSSQRTEESVPIVLPPSAYRGED